LEQYRKCIACGDVKSKSELIKITKEYISGDIVVQPNSKTFGRSAYLCYNKNCIENVFKKNRLNKILKTTVDIDKDELLNLLNTNK
jgi:predicted RNA-binding protein YlxR (DUF448 family)